MTLSVDHAKKSLQYMVVTGQDEAHDRTEDVGRRDGEILTPNLIEIVAALRLFTAVAWVAVIALVVHPDTQQPVLQDQT